MAPTTLSASRTGASGTKAEFAMLAVLCGVGHGVAIWGFSPDASLIAVCFGALTYLIATGLAGRAMVRSYPHAHVGWCNAVTVFRLLLTALLVSWLVSAPFSPWVVFAIATLALGLDGVDGWLARREGYVSDFGARFDMEVDSLLALVLAAHAYLAGSVGPIVLILGLPRYIFFILHAPLPWLAGDLPPRFSRKLVCVMQISVLIFAILPPAPPGLVTVAVIGVTVALIWSFWLDVRYLWRHRS
ncbi:CDP-alcohol phosphatidyltransferase family protein [Marivita sp. S6314]|uniref:CDP-alcohol phosphatidyltransferase family protein n=1 Tax=Marivita sp. S6314 TaxID=2926406 RepID=UPI001FF52ED3|nr:CDP-alcohol phosphatidyltransferase family protein [Marivita sp. S6314]MCK0149451.1 CDP-alcohol phosphatidyltransferase family protein [Marivita sp. S6314]